MKREKLKHQEYLSIEEMQVGDLIRLASFNKKRASMESTQKTGYVYQKSEDELAKQAAFDQSMNESFRYSRSGSSADGVKLPRRARTSHNSGFPKSEEIYIQPGSTIEVVEVNKDEKTIYFKYVSGGILFFPKTSESNGPVLELGANNQDSRVQEVERIIRDNVLKMPFTEFIKANDKKNRSWRVQWDAFLGMIGKK